MSGSEPPVLVVGAGGFVGAAAVRRLVASGRRVVAFGPPGRVPLPASVETIEGTIEDAGALADLFGTHRPATVLSFAAYSAGTGGLGRSADADPEAAFAVNVLGFRRLLAAAASAGVRRFLWTSSTVVLGAAAPGAPPVDEDTPRHPLHVYGLTKVLAEEIAAFHRRRDGIETVGLRIPLMLGPGLWYDGAASPIKRLADAAAHGGAETVEVTTGEFEVMHVDDLARLIDGLIDAPGPLAAIYHAAGFLTSYAEIVATLRALAPGFRATVTEVPPAVAYPIQDGRRLTRATGFQTACDLRAILADLLAERRKP